MTSNNISNGILKAVFSLIGIAIIILFIYQIQTVIVYLIVAMILALISNPLVEFLKKRLKFKNTLAVSLTMVFILLVIVGFIMMFVPLIADQGKNLSLLNTDSIQSNVLELVKKIEIYLVSHNIDAGNLLKESHVTEKLNFNFLPNFLNSVLNTISNFGMGMASVLFILFFFLKDKIYFIIGIKRILPNDHEEKILNSIDKIREMLSRYFIGLLLQLFIVFILYIIVLLIFGVENAFVIAFLCAILNIIPYIGPLIGSVLAAVLTMIGNLGGDFQTEILPTTLYVLLGFTIVQVIDNNVSQPIIFSKSVNSHPLEIFLITLISGFLFGITGMIVAIPLYTMLKVVAKEFIPENKIIQQITKNL
jgi:predicted PurR-regulated permease PerM